MRVPPDLVNGDYANMVAVWHTPYEFTLDFAVMLPPEMTEGPDGQPLVPCQVVGRIKIPPTLVFDLMRTLNDNMSKYEKSYGEIRRPQPPETPGENG